MIADRRNAPYPLTLVVARLLAVFLGLVDRAPRSALAAAAAHDPAVDP